MEVFVLMAPVRDVTMADKARVGRWKNNIQKTNAICKYNHYLLTT